MAEHQIWNHTANLTSGTGQVTTIELTEGSEFFLARAVYGSSGDDPALGGFTILRKSDFDALSSQSSDTPSIAEDPDGDNVLIVQNLPQAAQADFGYIGIFKRSGKLGLIVNATSITVEIRGLEIYEYPFQ